MILNNINFYSTVCSLTEICLLTLYLLPHILMYVTSFFLKYNIDQYDINGKLDSGALFVLMYLNRFN